MPIGENFRVERETDNILQKYKLSDFRAATLCMDARTWPASAG
jgi:hypothetical protein